MLNWRARWVEQVSYIGRLEIPSSLAIIEIECTTTPQNFGGLPLINQRSYHDKANWVRITSLRSFKWGGCVHLNQKSRVRSLEIARQSSLKLGKWVLNFWFWLFIIIPNYNLAPQTSNAHNFFILTLIFNSLLLCSHELTLYFFYSSILIFNLNFSKILNETSINHKRAFSSNFPLNALISNIINQKILDKIPEIILGHNIIFHQKKKNNRQFFGLLHLYGSLWNEPDHNVTVVDYGVSADRTKYWLLKNSWGNIMGRRRVHKNAKKCLGKGRSLCWKI